MKNTHLTLDDRKQIQEGLEKELTRTEIAKIIKKDISTVAKEIKLRRIAPGLALPLLAEIPFQIRCKILDRASFEISNKSAI